MTRSIYPAFLLFLVVLLSSCSRGDGNNFLNPAERQWLAEHGADLRLAPDMNFAPFEFIDGDGKFKGIASDYVRLIEKELGIAFRIVHIPDWSDNVRAAKAREFDLWSAVVKTPRRLDYMHFATPYIEMQPVYVVSQNWQGEITPERIDRYSIGVVRGYFLHDYLRREHPDARVTTYATIEKGLRGLENREVEVFLSDTTTVSYTIRHHNIRHVKVGGDIPVESRKLAFASRSDWPILNDILEKTLARISDAERQRIHQKWIGLAAENPPDKKGQDRMAMTMMLRAAILLLALYFFWKRLFRQGTSKTGEAGVVPPGRMPPEEKYLSRYYVLFVALGFIATVIGWAGYHHYRLDGGREFLNAREKNWLNAHRESLRLAPDMHFAPYEFVDENGQFSGIAAEYVRLLENKLKVRFDMQRIPKWSDNVRKARAGEIDIWSAVAPTSKKREYMLFTNPYISIQTVLIVSEGKEGEVSLQDWGNKSIAVVDGYFTHDYLLKYYPDSNLKTYRNAPAGIRAVSFKEADAMLIDIATAAYLIEKEGLTNLKVGGSVELDYDLAFASRKDRPVLNSILEKGLAQITKAERNNIHRKWIHYDQWSGHFHPDRMFWLVLIVGGGSILLLTGGVLFWNISLRKMVSGKTRELLESEEYLRATLESTDDGILVQLKDSSPAHINKRFIEMWEIPADLTGLENDVELLDFISDQIEEESPLLSAHYTQTSHCFMETSNILHLKNGRIVEGYSCPLIIEDEEMGQVWSFRDITARQKAEQEKGQLELQLRQAQKMEAIGTLAGGIAHDFNNILSAILGYTELAYMDSQDEGKEKAELLEVLNAANRAKDLVKQILAFSRRSEEEKRPLKIQHIIKEVLKLLRASIPTTVEIRHNIDMTCGPVQADPTQIHQLLMNLCTNAVQVLENEGMLEISLDEITLNKSDLIMYPEIKPGLFVHLAVKDDGKGMDRSVQERIFDPFFTTKEVGEGTGMGLAMVYGIVQSYGGLITVDSAPGKGSVFHVYLPVVRSQAVDKKDNDREEKIRIMGGNETVLFIDDEETITDLAGKFLKRLGYNVIAKNRSRDALKYFRDNVNRIDVVLTDQTMPGMTGADLAVEILKIRPDMPIILCTGYSSMINDEKARQLGIREFALKPLAGDHLALLIRKVMDES